MSHMIAMDPQQLIIAGPTKDEELFEARVKGKLPGMRPRLIDLFAGAGGMTVGFSPLMGHLFEPVWANDCNTYAVETYNANFGGHCISGDIVDLLRDPTLSIPQADVVIGGPPPAKASAY
jgi:DNA (cytosine-5)-methyltransferase 1